MSKLTKKNVALGIAGAVGAGSIISGVIGLFRPGTFSNIFNYPTQALLPLEATSWILIGLGFLITIAAAVGYAFGGSPSDGDSPSGGGSHDNKTPSNDLQPTTIAKAKQKPDATAKNGKQKVVVASDDDKKDDTPDAPITPDAPK